MLYYKITGITHNHHANIYPLLNYKTTQAALRETIQKEVDELKVLRIELFCRFVEEKGGD